LISRRPVFWARAARPGSEFLLNDYRGLKDTFPMVPFDRDGFIWMNGKLIAWRDAAAR
jgi:hypothetical protein